MTPARDHPGQRVTAEARWAMLQRDGPGTAAMIRERCARPEIWWRAGSASPSLCGVLDVSPTRSEQELLEHTPARLDCGSRAGSGMASASLRRNRRQIAVSPAAGGDIRVETTWRTPLNGTMVPSMSIGTGAGCW